ncbi:MAG: hypothetical protein J6S67_17770 [Methanobrevibacter sp.]|nr:hypothetical protein [Methanobrevibacter sp.]
MHFCILYIMKGVNIEDTGIGEIEQDFGERFCYSCGESKPKYESFCDWFQVGGRWNDIIKARKGIKGDPSFMSGEESEEGYYTIVDVNDIEEEINHKMIYGVATKSRIYTEYDQPEKVMEWLEKIANHKFKGCVAIIDCHD